MISPGVLGAIHEAVTDLVIPSIAVLVSLLLHRSIKLKVEINSRMDKLIKTTGEASHAQGFIAGVDDERRKQARSEQPEDKP